MEKGGNMPCILNAANEVVVAAFLIDKIGFLEMSDVIEKVMEIPVLLRAHQSMIFTKQIGKQGK